MGGGEEKWKIVTEENPKKNRERKKRGYGNVGSLWNIFICVADAGATLRAVLRTTIMAVAATVRTWTAQRVFTSEDGCVGRSHWRLPPSARQEPERQHGQRQHHRGCVSGGAKRRNQSEKPVGEVLRRSGWPDTCVSLAAGSIVVGNLHCYRELRVNPLPTFPHTAIPPTTFSHPYPFLSQPQPCSAWSMIITWYQVEIMRGESPKSYLRVTRGLTDLLWPFSVSQQTLV